MRRLPRKLRSFLEILAAAAVALVTRSSLADQYVVPSGSMEPTVAVGDHVLVSKIAYGLRVPGTHQWLAVGSGPERGDVVVLDSPEEPVVLLKRVVAVPGDWVEVRGGVVRIDGQRRDLPLGSLDGRGPLASLDDGPGSDFGPARVPDGQVLVLGDHRGNSRDGRSFGFVPRERVLGRVERVAFRGGRLAWERVDLR